VYKILLERAADLSNTSFSLAVKQESVKSVDLTPQPRLLHLKKVPVPFLLSISLGRFKYGKANNLIPSIPDQYTIL